MEDTVTIKIMGMHCNSCASLITMSLGEVPGVKKANVDYSKAMAEVVFDSNKTDPSKLLKTVEEGGYKAVI